MSERLRLDVWATPRAWGHAWHCVPVERCGDQAAAWLDAGVVPDVWRACHRDRHECRAAGARLGSVAYRAMGKAGPDFADTGTDLQRCDGIAGRLAGRRTSMGPYSPDDGAPEA